jgi:hypothetical protein
MKLRIKGNSIRLRLTQTEVANFAQIGYLEEQTEFGNTTFTYALANVADVQSLAAIMEGAKITVQVPTVVAQKWISTNEVGFQCKQALSNGKELFLLVEKDFVCLDNTFEDQSDNYPNPNAHC